MTITVVHNGNGMGQVLIIGTWHHCQKNNNEITPSLLLFFLCTPAAFATIHNSFAKVVLVLFTVTSIVLYLAIFRSAFKCKKFDSDLERLREQISEPLNLETVVLNLHQTASQIHASYLFENEGKELLQKLCLFLSATASGKSYGDWKKFAACLGLMTEQINCIDYDFKGLQDPTYYVLLTFVQCSHGTMDKVFHALQSIDRLDIINRVTETLNNFIREIIQNKGITSVLPRAPLVLSPLPESHHSQHQESPPSICTDNPNLATKKTNLKYGSIVLLTFADDGRETVARISKVLRSKNPKVGVIILQEQEKHVFCGAEGFVEDCFKQVNYVVPVLTRGYLNRIDNSIKEEIGCINLDSKYVRYIFSLMRYEYVKENCTNNRIRCIIPDAEVEGVLSMNLHPILQAWFRESDISSFAERILLQNF
ncbi:hypothetical protein QAD02_022100 [Eretmocerus hayati]|uniref:Uncharacterized protein n=1 Tax=Eretmocerus hayati TaxID=131215 RepID=A0ACC2PU48_9HYME|nr:hypothetical protein QAD02_022100 [Eretmocerus hayati]